MQNEVLLLDLFQLENLLNNQVAFLYFNLSQTKVGESHAKLLESARKVSLSEAYDAIKNESEDLFHPIVLVCETGELSGKLGKQLAEEGFVNVCVLEGGLFNQA